MAMATALPITMCDCCCYRFKEPTSTHIKPTNIQATRRHDDGGEDDYVDGGVEDNGQHGYRLFVIWITH